MRIQSRDLWGCKTNPKGLFLFRLAGAGATEVCKFVKFVNIVNISGYHRKEIRIEM